MGSTTNDSIPAKGYAVLSAGDSFEIFDFQRRALKDEDILIRIHYCGICHTDIHQAKNDWKGSMYPMIPGHEITGVVEQIGKDVTKFQVGDHAGVGCHVDSCRQCTPCKRNFEQHCPDVTNTYNSIERDTKTTSYGGYSNFITVKEHYAFIIPKNLPLDAAAPLLCAGITTYSPLHRYKVGSQTRMGVVGLGGLGHMAVKFGAAMGAHVTIISTSESKRNDAMKLGAKGFLLSTNKEEMAQAKSTFDFIIDTVSANHDVGAILNLLAFEGVYCVVGAPAKPMEIAASPLIRKNPIITGSLTGGMKETQDMLDFCGKHQITSDIEKIETTPESIKVAYERTMKSDVKYRFVLDILNAFQP